MWQALHGALDSAGVLWERRIQARADAQRKSDDNRYSGVKKVCIFICVQFNWEWECIQNSDRRRFYSRMSGFHLSCCKWQNFFPFHGWITFHSKFEGIMQLEGLMLKLKLQYFGHLMWRADSFEKTLMLGKIEGRWRRGWQRMRWLDGITNSTDEFD